MYFLKNVKTLTLAMSMIAGMTAAHAAPNAPQHSSSASKVQKAARNRNRSPKPNPDKPFEGEWRLCLKNKKTGKPVCASHFVLQQGKQVCGVWQEIHSLSYKVYSGFFQASVEPENLAIRAYVSDLARINFGCTQEEYSGEFSVTECGKDPQKIIWGQQPLAGTEATGYFGATTCEGRHVASVVPGITKYSAMCYYAGVNYLPKYRPLTARKKEELMQLSWMPQCLSGQKPENVDSSGFR